MVNTDPKQRHDGFYCKGSFALGTACGNCDKCAEEIKNWEAELGPQWADILSARLKQHSAKPTFGNLGKQTPHVLVGADAKLLEAVPFDGHHVTIQIVGEEFTSLCPATGGPDFGKITIQYAPRELIVESKSLKYYMESFRNEPIFHERVVNKMRDDLVALLSPASLTVFGEFKPRGGWAINPYASYVRPVTSDDGDF